MSKQLVRAFGLVALSLALSASASAQGGTLRGTIRERATQLPLPGASVSVMQPTVKDQAEVKFQDLAKEDGTFTIVDIPPGNYSITVIYPGLKPEALRQVPVRAGQTETVDITLGNY